MRRRKALQTIAMGFSGLGLLSHCTSSSSLPRLLEIEDQHLLRQLTEAILPSKSEEFPTPETRMEYLLNQIQGALTTEELVGYQCF